VPGTIAPHRHGTGWCYVLLAIADAENLGFDCATNANEQNAIQQTEDVEGIVWSHKLSLLLED